MKKLFIRIFFPGQFVRAEIVRSIFNCLDEWEKLADETRNYDLKRCVKNIRRRVLRS